MSQDGAQGRYAGRSVGRRPLPAARPARRGRHGLRAPRLRLRARPPGRDQDPAHRTGPRAVLPRALPPRGPGRGQAHAHQHRLGLRHRRGRRSTARSCRTSSWSTSRASRCGSVLDEDVAQYGAMPADKALKITARRAGGAGDQPRDGPGPPGHQARQRDDDQARRRQGHGLRHRPRHAVRRHVDDPDRHGRRHPAVPLARAGPGPRRGRALRPVLGRHHALRTAHRAAAVRRGLAAGHRVRARPGGAGRALLDQPVAAARRWTRWSPAR